MGNCFKKSAFTDAIIHEGWRNHQCNIELPFHFLKLEVYMNIRRRTVLDHHEPYCFSRTDFITSTSSLLHLGFPFYGWPWCKVFMPPASAEVCSWCPSATALTAGTWWKTCGIRFLQYGLFIPSAEGCALESTALNQWPRGWERILSDKLEPTSSHKRAERTSDNGSGRARKLKSIGI